MTLVGYFLGRETMEGGMVFVASQRAGAGEG